MHDCIGNTYSVVHKILNYLQEERFIVTGSRLLVVSNWRFYGYWWLTKKHTFLIRSRRNWMVLRNWWVRRNWELWKTVA